MAKKHRENIDSENEPRVKWNLPLVPDGITARILNEDDSNGAVTALLDIPAGWEWNWKGYNKGPQEFFVIDGTFIQCNHRLTNGCYSYYPPGSLQENWKAEKSSTIYALFDSKPSFIESSTKNEQTNEEVIPNINTWEIEWVDPLKVTDPTTPFPPGAFIKPLRVNKETLASTYLAGLMPGWACELVEEHPVGEEEFTLGGDLLLGEVAGGYTLKKGSYFCRPPGVRHGPLVTKNGVVIICHPTGMLEINYHTNPDAKKIMSNYFEHKPWK